MSRIEPKSWLILVVLLVAGGIAAREFDVALGVAPDELVATAHAGVADATREQVAQPVDDGRVFTMRVVDADGAPVEDAEVTVGAWRDEPWVRFTDEHGVATLPLVQDRQVKERNVADGWVRKSGYCPARFEVVLAAGIAGGGASQPTFTRGYARYLHVGKRAAYKAVVLDRPAMVTGFVVNVDGTPVAGARIDVQDREGMLGLWEMFYTDSDGRWFAPAAARELAGAQRPRNEFQPSGRAILTHDWRQRGFPIGSKPVGLTSETLPAGVPLRWRLELADGSIYGEESVLEPGMNRRTWRVDPSLAGGEDRFGFLRKGVDMRFDAGTDCFPQ